MENPYTKDQILSLIARKFESSKVDYKVSYPLDEKHRRELIKDIIAMANTIDTDESLIPHGFETGYGFIIIGCDENGQLHDISADNLKDEVLQQIISEYVEPKLNFLYVPFDHEVDGVVISFGVIIVGPSERPPYRVKRFMHQQGKDVPALKDGSCFMRLGTITLNNISDAELERMFEYRARSSETEQRLQKEEFRISQDEKERYELIYVPPESEDLIKSVWKKLIENRFLLLYGEMGVGKRSMAFFLAQRLVTERYAFRILRLSRYTAISELRDAEGAVILIPDAFGLFRLERFDMENDIGLIQELAQKNFIIFTSSENVLQDVLGETRLGEWELMGKGRFQLQTKAYSVEARREILERHLSWAAKQGRMEVKQAESIKKVFHGLTDSIIQAKLMLPLDIRRLVDDKLVEVKKPTASVINEVLAEFGNIEIKIRDWYLALDPNLQCFLFVLSLFDGLGTKEIWDWYTLIVSRLRKYIPDLSIIPFGIASYKCSPYVASTAGIPAFVHPSFHKAVLQAISEVYREPFILLTDDFIKKSMPSLDNEEEVLKSRPVREAVATFAGQLAEFGVEDLIKLIESWASHKKGKVRVSAAEVLVQASHNRAQRDVVLNILSHWSNSDDFSKRWTAAVTYGQLNQTMPDAAISGLRRLANDEKKIVRSGVPKALRPFSTVRRGEASKIYSTLSVDQDSFTRREVSRSLRSIAFTNPGFVLDLLKNWIILISERRIWTLVRSCFIIPSNHLSARFELIENCLKNHAATCQSALDDAINYDDLKINQAWSVIRMLVEQFDKNSNFDLINLPILANVLIKNAPEESWHVIQTWVEHPKIDIRLAAANILVSLKSDHIERVEPLLAKLTMDESLEVSEAASKEPSIDLTDLTLDSELIDLTTNEPNEETDEVLDMTYLSEQPQENVIDLSRFFRGRIQILNSEDSGEPIIMILPDEKK